MLCATAAVGSSLEAAIGKAQLVPGVVLLKSAPVGPDDVCKREVVFQCPAGLGWAAPVPKQSPDASRESRYAAYHLPINRCARLPAQHCTCLSGGQQKKGHLLTAKAAAERTKHACTGAGTLSFRQTKLMVTKVYFDHVVALLQLNICCLCSVLACNTCTKPHIVEQTNVQLQGQCFFSGSANPQCDSESMLATNSPAGSLHTMCR